MCIRDSINAVAKALKIKGYDLDVQAYQALESERKALQVESEELQAKRNARSKEIGKTKAQGGDVDALMAEVASFADQLKAAQQKLEEVKAQLLAITQSIPNVPDASVPAGSSEDDNVEVSKWGTPREFDFEPKDHVDLGEALGGLDFETATKITGSRFVVMKGALARMNRALIQYMLDTHTQEHSYDEVYVPYLVNQDSLLGTGQLPKFEEDQFKTQSEDGLYLIPTCLLYTSPSPRDLSTSRMPSSA